MTTANTLRNWCEEILNIYPVENRYKKKIQLRKWIRKEGINIATGDIDGLNMEQLGIFMSCGAYGDLYSYANVRARDLKDKPRPPAEKQEPGENTPQGVTLTWDVTKGFEQFTVEQIKDLVDKSDERDVYEIARLCAEKLTTKDGE